MYNAHMRRGSHKELGDGRDDTVYNETLRDITAQSALDH